MSHKHKCHPGNDCYTCPNHDQCQARLLGVGTLVLIIALTVLFTVLVSRL